MAGLHRHALMALMTNLFLQSRHLKAARLKKSGRPPPQPSVPAIGRRSLSNSRVHRL